MTGKLPKEKRSKVRKQVAHAVDAWFDAAYLGGDYPRNDFADVVARLHRRRRRPTPRATRRLMSNQDIGADIDGVEATDRKVTVDVLAVKGHPAGPRRTSCSSSTPAATSSARSRSAARLFLTPGDDGWQVFGYDVTKGRCGMRSRLRWVTRGWSPSPSCSAVAALVVPDSTVKPTEMELVKINRATGVDYDEAPRTSSGSWRSAPTRAPART